MNKVELYYNNISEKVYSGDYTSFDTLSLSEFVNFVLPKQELDIYHITLESYLDNSMKQAEGECGEKPPVVAHRKNGGPWMVTMLAPTFFNLIKERESNAK